jgi:hypothetical protein
MPGYQMGLLEWMPYVLHARYITRDFVDKLQDKPELFLLLSDEARKSQASPSPLVDMILKENFPGEPTDSDNYLLARAAVSDLLMIIERFNQLQNDLKISQPAVSHVLADQREKIGVDFVQLQATDYVSKVPAPTTQQVQDQFNKYANVLPGPAAADSTNPFGFGYKIPVLAQVQSLVVNPKSISDAVIAAGPADIHRPEGWTQDLWWDLAGRKYYQSHLDDFRETPPASSAVQPAAPQPVKTYEKVRDEVLQAIRQPGIDKLNEDVKTYLNTSLTAGWQTYRQYVTTSPLPATEPAASVGAPYSSTLFLQKLVDTVRSRFNVTMTIGDTQQPIALAKIADVPGLANENISKFVAAQANAFVSAADPKSAATTADMMRPSSAIQSSSSAPMVFVRLTQVLPAAPPKDIALVKADIETDLIKTASYDLAKADGNALLTAAGNGTLAASAEKTGHHVVSTLPNSPLSLATSEDTALKPTGIIYPPLAEYETTFNRQAFSMLGTYSPDKNPHPAKIIEAPLQGRLFVVQVKNVTADWNAEEYYKNVLQVRRVLAQEMLPQLADKWFDYDEVIRRTGYKSTKPAGG